MKEDTKSSLVGFAVFSFIGGFFFPPLFAVGVFLLYVAYFPRIEFEKHARRIRDENTLRLVSSHLLRPIQAQLEIAISRRSIEEQLQNNPGVARIFNTIEIKLPADEPSVHQPININRHLSKLASLLPTNAELAAKLIHTQKECASELRRIRHALKADAVLFQIFRTVKISNAPDTFDAFKAFSALGEPSTNQSSLLAREVGAFESFLQAAPQALLTGKVAADEPKVTAYTGAPPITSTSHGKGPLRPLEVAASPVKLGTEAASKVAKSYAEGLSRHPRARSKKANSYRQLAHVIPRPAPSKQAPLLEQPESRGLQVGSMNHPTLQEALDAYEDSRREDREASYELLSEELSTFQAEAAIPAEDWALRSWQDELGGSVLREARIQRGANEELLLQLRRSGVGKLYHFTDRQNLQSIIRNGGLYSWFLCETSNLVIGRPGGSTLSRQLDLRKGLQDYVRLGFVKDHPMMYTAISDGRISDPVILEIDLDVVRFSDVLFSDRNAVANGANVGPGLDVLRGIHFDLIQRGQWRTEEEKGFYQAEVLIRGAVPGYLIRHEGRLIRTRPDFDLDDDIPF